MLLICRTMAYGADANESLPPASSCLQILVAFVLFDMDEDGKLSFEEVNMYIASVLRVIRALSHDVPGDG